MSNSLQQLNIIVPVFNEEENLATLFQSFHKLQVEFRDVYCLNYILVDDGSTDKTVDTARGCSEGLQLTVLQHPDNMGPGAAFATAFSYLADKLDKDDWVITMEGDNTSRYELIQQMFTRSKEGFDVILASPYMYGGGLTETSLLRKILSGGANLLVKDVLGIQGILTVSSFFRLYRGSIILKLQSYYGLGIVERSGFESMVELVMKLVICKATISEVAMELDSSLRKGKSKMNIRRTIFGYTRLWKYKSRWMIH